MDEELLTMGISHDIYYKLFLLISRQKQMLISPKYCVLCFVWLLMDESILMCVRVGRWRCGLQSGHDVRVGVCRM